MRTLIKKLSKLYPAGNENRLLFVSAFAIVIVNGIALLFTKMADGNRDAERYYKKFDPLKYYILKFCYAIIAVSFTFNMRYLMSGVLVHAKKYVLTKTPVKKLAPKSFLRGLPRRARKI